MVKTVVTVKTYTLPDLAMVELVSYAIGLLIYRGLGTVQDMRDLKALLDELSQSTPTLKVA